MLSVPSRSHWSSPIETQTRDTETEGLPECSRNGLESGVSSLEFLTEILSRDVSLSRDLDQVDFLCHLRIRRQKKLKCSKYEKSHTQQAD